MSEASSPETSRRLFIRRSCAVGAGFTAGAIVGCGSSGSQEVGAQVPGGGAQVPEPRTTLDTGVTLHYEAQGSGRAVVLLPGWTCNAWFFQHQLPALAAAGYRAVAIDPRGCGSSEKTLDGHSFAQRGRDLDAFLRALGIDRVVLVGWSYGAYDMLAYLRDHGAQRVAGVVLVDEPPTSPGAAPNDSANPAAWSEIPDVASVIGFARGVVDDRKAFWTDYARYMIGATGRQPATEALVAQIVEQGMLSPQFAAAQMILDGMASDYAPTLKALDGAVPTLVFARDDWAAAARAWTQANLARAQFATMPCHMGFFVQPEAFNARLLQFLGALA